MKKLLLSALAFACLAGCQTTITPTDNAPTHTPNTLIVVKNPTEPMMCTMQYDPVCGKVANSNSSFSYKTYGNACTARNSPDNVVSYSQGACDSVLSK